MGTQYPVLVAVCPPLGSPKKDNQRIIDMLSLTRVPGVRHASTVRPFLISTGPKLEFHDIDRELGLVSASAVHSKNVLHDLMMAIGGVFGGESHSYTELLDETIEESVQRVAQIAKVSQQIVNVADKCLKFFCAGTRCHRHYQPTLSDQCPSKSIYFWFTLQCDVLWNSDCDAGERQETPLVSSFGFAAGWR